MTEALEPKLIVKIGDEEVTLFMSFGLLDKLTTKFGDVTNAVENSMFDSEQRTDVLRIVLQKRGEYGKYPKAEAEKLDMEDVPISVDDVTNIFKWVLEHVSDFFLRAAENVMSVQEANMARQEALKPSSTPSAPGLTG